MIDFKTYEEQLELLKSRNIVIENEEWAKNILITNNYYNLINAYKDIFLIKGHSPDIYIQGTTFDEIYALHQFDKELLHILLRTLRIIERSIKAIISYEFTNAYKKHDRDYLNIYNFNEPALPIECSKLISILNKTLQREIDDNNPMICHYYDVYHAVPLWVFSNVLTFGTISKFYSLMRQSEQVKIAHRLSDVTGHNIYVKDIENALKILVLLRNKCAHDQRVFDFNFYPLSVSPQMSLLSKHKIKNVSHNLFGAFACIYLLVDDDQFKGFVYLFRNALSVLFNKIHSVPTKVIIDKMGIPLSFIQSL
jgi:abortive infection bacteriophage resistance protein